jgi:UDP-glucose 4-epimerase
MTTNGVRHLVFSSTAAVYGQPERMPITEDTETRPINTYGASKLAFERMIVLAEKAGLINAVRLRYFNVAGAWPNGSLGEAHVTETHIVPLLLRAAAKPGATFTINGNDYPTADGTCVRDYLHVVDLAEAHLRAVEYLADGGDGVVGNLGSGGGYSNLEVAEMCAAVTGGEIPIVYGERRQGDPAMLIASNTQARNVLGWAPRRDLRAMVDDAWRWHTTHPEGYAAEG